MDFFKTYIQINSWSHVLLLFSLTFFSFGCGGAKQTYLHPKYQKHDRTRTLRLGVIATSSSDALAQNQALLKMWAHTTQKYMNDHRDFVVVSRFIKPFSVKQACAYRDQEQRSFHGVFLLHGQGTKFHNEIELQFNGILYRCDPDLTRLWTGESKGEWPFQDQVLVELRKQKIKQHGESVSSWVVGSFYALRNLLQLLPYPELKDDDLTMEKIDLE